MNREKGIARCGLACCLCTEPCDGCGSAQCPDRAWCVNRRCSMEKGLTHCYQCDTPCREGLRQKVKPFAFSEFARRYGEEALLDALERKERAGVRYHVEGYHGDYDAFGDSEALIAFLQGEENA